MKNKSNFKIKKGIISVICTLLLVIGGLNYFPAKAEETSTTLNQWTTMASMNQARDYSTSTVLNGKIYAIGGWNKESLSSVEAYDPITNAWTIMTSMNQARRLHTSVELNGKIYAIGGYNAGALSSVEAYDPAKNTWTQVASMAKARYLHTSVVLNGKIYAIGGDDGKSIEAYDPITNTWTTMASMKVGRSYNTSVVLNGKIYVIGGAGSSATESSVEVYDPIANTWTTIASMNTARVHHTSVVLNGKIYSIGGQSGNSLFSSVEAYDLVANTWTTVASMEAARQDNTSVVLNGKIYTIGGYANKALLLSAYVYDPTTNVWTTTASMKNARTLSTSIVLNGKIYAIGGNGSAGVISSVEAYEVCNIKLNKTSSSLNVGETDSLTATTTPAGIGVSWTSSDPSIATVDETGKVTAIKAGTVNITAKSTDGSDLYATCAVTVNGVAEPESEITLNKTSLSLNVGQTDTLTATTKPSDVKVNWSSKDTGIATVDLNGKVTGIAVGTTTVTATTTDGKTATCEVTVTAQNIPTNPTGDRAVLTLTMSNNAIKNYDLSNDELNAFLNWYDARSKGIAQAYYIFENKPSGGNLTNKDYIPYDKIEYFNVAEYKSN